LEALVKECGVMLAPRALADPPNDGLEPSGWRLAMAGRIAPDFMAVDGSASADSFLRWWSQRLEAMLGSLDGRTEGHYRRGRDWANRALELAPARFSAATTDDPGCNLSAWNLHEHTLDSTPAGLRVDDDWPLRLIDFNGFMPDSPYRLDATTTRVRVSRIPALKALCSRYAQELHEAGWRRTSRYADIGRQLANGLAFDEAMHALYDTACILGEEFGDLFSAEGTDAFMDWLRAPAEHDAAQGVNRYITHRILRERPDVRAAYPDFSGADGPGFVAWCRTFGVVEMGIPDILMPTPPDRDVKSPTSADSAESLLGATLPTGSLAVPPPEHPEPSTAVDGAPLSVRVFGYMGHVLGLGAAARGYVRALSAANVPVSTVTVPLDHLQVSVDLAAMYGRHLYEDARHGSDHAFELVCVNADELPGFIDTLGEDYFEGGRIGVWGWETNSIPARWQRAFKLVDEIWVYSDFMARNISAVAPVPVIPLPPPVQAPTKAPAPLRLGVPDSFLFLFLFDYLSTIQRKNPVGLIEAFKRAFAPGEGPRLLLKSINAPLRPLAEEEILWAAEDRSDIHVIDRSLTADQVEALMAACDCYVSLHRSEGFGLTLAEAMSIGKPVIATAYSGNVDFMNDGNSLLVEYTMTRVGPGCEIYPADGEWAEPSVEHAAKLMREVYEDRERAAQIGARARGDIAQLLSPERTGAAMRSRLLQLADQRAERAGAADARTPVTAVATQRPE
jgi:glycosyltransferase involved in cell wall biosynthesis